MWVGVGLFAGGLAVSALLTLAALRTRFGRRVASIAHAVLAFGLLAYLAAFIALYRPEGWLPVALGSVEPILQMPTARLAALWGIVAGTLLVLAARRRTEE